MGGNAIWRNRATRARSPIRLCSRKQGSRFGEGVDFGRAVGNSDTTASGSRGWHAWRLRTFSPPRSAPARGLPSTPSSSSPAEGGGARGPTLTQKIRSVQPPDVARQAMSELGVLAHELDTLPGLLESAGLVHSHQRTYFEASDAYLTLAQQAWMSVAEERLEQSGAEPEYRQHAIGVADALLSCKMKRRELPATSPSRCPVRLPCSGDAVPGC